MYLARMETVVFTLHDKPLGCLALAAPATKRRPHRVLKSGKSLTLATFRSSAPS